MAIYQLLHLKTKKWRIRKDHLLKIECRNLNFKILISSGMMRRASLARKFLMKTILNWRKVFELWRKELRFWSTVLNKIKRKLLDWRRVTKYWRIALKKTKNWENSWEYLSNKKMLIILLCAKISKNSRSNLKCSKVRTKKYWFKMMNSRNSW